MENKFDDLEKMLEAFDGIKCAEAPDNLFEKTLERIKLTERKIKSVQLIPMRVVWRVAAIFIGIAFLNFYCFKTYLDKTETEQNKISSTEAVKEMYFSPSVLTL